MMRRKHVAIIIMILSCSSVLFNMFATNAVYARVDAQRSSVITQKALLQGLSYCYIHGAINDTVDPISSFNDFAEQQVKDSNPYGNENYVALPSGLTLIEDNGVSCRQLFGGYYGASWNKFEKESTGSGNGIFSFFGKKGRNFSTSDNNVEKSTFLEGMGYKKEDSSGKCVAYAYTKKWVNYNAKNVSGTAYTKNVCAKNGTFDLQDYDVNSSDAPLNITLSSDKQKITKLSVKKKEGGGIFAGGIDVDTDISASSSNWQTDLNTAISTNFQYFISDSGDPLDGQFYFDRAAVNGEGDTFYKIPNASSRRSDKFSEAADKAINYLSGGKYQNRNDIGFSKSEQLSYYIQAIKEWFYDGVDNSGNSEYWVCDKNDWSMYGSFTLEVEINSEGKIGECRIDPDKAKKKSDDYDNGKLSNNSNRIYGFKSDIIKKGDEEYRAFDSSGATQLTLAEVVTLINDLVDNMTDEEKEEMSEEYSTITGEDSDPCYEAGVEGMSWVLCPALNNMKYTASALDNVIQEWLSVDSSWYNNDSSTFNVWEIMRNVANAALTIILLIVIFSQLTGYGIDNYGIKKILPRLVIMAVVVNLSFVICELAVDLSNVLGVGLRDMFGAIGKSLYAARDELFGEEFIGSMISGIFAMVGVGGVVAPTAIAATSAGLAGSGAMAVIIIVLALIVVLFAVLLFFVMLGARMIIIILCIAISPVAFALYILPNTQGLFKKWWKLFETVLVMFPICGALGGISYMIKAMVKTAPEWDLWMMVVALIAPYLCFFMLPILLKGAIGLLAGVGAAFTAMASGIKSGAAKGASAVENTERYKDAQKEVARRNQERRASRIVGRLKDRKDLSDRDMRRLARSQETLDKLKNEDRAARSIWAGEKYKDETLSQLGKRWDEAFDGRDEAELDALTSVISSRYGAAGANEIASRLAKKKMVGSDGTVDEGARSMVSALRYNMNNDSTLANNMKNKASDAFGMISNGGVGKDGKYHDMGYFSKNNDIAKDVKDWSTQSAGTLRRAMDNGALDESMIRTLLSSTDPSVQSGIQSDKSKRDALQARLYQIETNPSGIGPNLPEERAAQAYRERQQAALNQARSESEQQQQELTDTLREINENLKHNNGGPHKTSGGVWVP